MTKAIMIQGTMSNVGKSLIAAGLCRIFRRDGYRVAPFKSQNMALNSFITEEGLEMGRAQVMQAEAAGIRPDVRMNPVLLKPTNDIGSQIIVNGEVRGTMSAREYFAYKRSLVPEIMEAYRSLCSENDIIVIEGAGSPAEINLKSDDIVNMGMAKMAGAPVLLVGDIDRGGVFAQLIGTVDLLEDDERRLVKGLVINKFRGDKGILDPGLAIIEEKTGIPVVGTCPYLRIDIEDEDSLSERITGKNGGGIVDIAVIALPRMSNFTDLNPFDMIPGVSVRYCRRASDILSPDMIVIPGSKNTIEDVLWMRQNGMEAEIMKSASKGCLIFGICGGFQILGESIFDPDGVEGGGRIRGMGLLPVSTVFRPEKTRTRVKGKITGGVFGGSNMSIDGYEIHMGTSELGEGCCPLLEIRDSVTGVSKLDGAVRDNVYGTYVHGFFDGEGAAYGVAKYLANRKGLDIDEDVMSYSEYKESQYDLLADALSNNLDMKEIYRILEEGVQVL